MQRATYLGWFWLGGRGDGCRLSRNPVAHVQSIESSRNPVARIQNMRPNRNPVIRQRTDPRRHPLTYFTIRTVHLGTSKRA